MFAKTFHPADSRHPDNRAKTKEMKARRFGETRSAKHAQTRGGVFNTQTADDIRAALSEVETAPVVDLAAQKRLKKRLVDPARKQGEKAFWQSQPWWLRVGPLSILNQFRAIDAGEKAAGTPAWLRVISLPTAVLLMFALMRLDVTGEQFNAALFGLTQWMLSIANAILAWVT